MSVVYLIVRAIAKRDRRAVFIVVGYLAQLVPWMLVSRLTFAYHYFAAVVFLVLALCAVFDEMRARGHIRWMYAFTGVSLVLFAAFYPVLTGVEVSRMYSWKVLKWFPSWPFNFESPLCWAFREWNLRREDLARCELEKEIFPAVILRPAIRQNATLRSPRCTL